MLLLDVPVATGAFAVGTGRRIDYSQIEPATGIAAGLLQDGLLQPAANELARVGHEIPVGEVRTALSEVPRDTNTRGRRRDDSGVRLDALPTGPLREALDRD